MDVTKYIDYINSNTEEVAEYINQCFEKEKENIKEKFIEAIKDNISEDTEHYIVKPNKRNYNSPGILKQDGTINMDQTIEDFFEEYSGNNRPKNGYFETYEDSYQSFTIEIATGLMWSSVRKYIKEKFSVEISDDDLFKIDSGCWSFNDLYDNSVAIEFFSPSFVAEYIGIRHKTLTEFKKEYPSSQRKIIPVSVVFEKRKKISRGTYHGKI